MIIFPTLEQTVNVEVSCQIVFILLQSGTCLDADELKQQNWIINFKVVWDGHTKIKLIGTHSKEKHNQTTTR